MKRGLSTMNLFYISFVKMQCIFTLLLEFFTCQNSPNKAAGAVFAVWFFFIRTRKVSPGSYFFSYVSIPHFAIRIDRG